jgi:hypothetical protein
MGIADETRKIICSILERKYKGSGINEIRDAIANTESISIEIVKRECQHRNLTLDEKRKMLEQVWFDKANSNLFKRTFPNSLENMTDIQSNPVVEVSAPTVVKDRHYFNHNATFKNIRQVGLILSRKFTIHSIFRDHRSDPFPHTFSFNMEQGDMPGRIIKLKLLKIHVPSGFTQYDQGDHCPFYLQLKDVTTDHTLQNDKQKKIAQFACHSYIDFFRNYPVCFVDDESMVLYAEVSFSSRIQLSVLDIMKNPMDMTQDIYSITSVAMNGATLRTEFTVGNHSIIGGESIIVMGVIYSADRNLYGDKKILNAIVLSPTLIAVTDYSAAPGTFTYENPRIMAINKNVEIILEYYYNDKERREFVVS